MLRRLLIVLLLPFALPTVVCADQVVLVVSASSPITSLDTTEIRKLFLGWPVFSDNAPLHPIRNVSDPQLQQIFFQQVVAMSQSSYEHRVLAGVLKQGRPRPLELSSKEVLLATLYADPRAVTYVWRQDVIGNQRIRVLRVIW